MKSKIILLGILIGFCVNISAQNTQKQLALTSAQNIELKANQTMQVVENQDIIDILNEIQTTLSEIQSNLTMYADQIEIGDIVGILQETAAGFNNTNTSNAAGFDNTLTTLKMVNRDISDRINNHSTCASCGSNSNNTSNKNYTTTIITTPNGELETREYFDGLGRLQQVVAKGVTPLEKDLVTFYEYEGGKTKQWLPTAVADNNGNFVTNFASKAKQFHGDQNPFVTKETSAFSVKVTRAGAEWASSYTEVSVDVNAANDVKKFRVSGDDLEQNGFYAAAELIKTTGTNEESKVGIKFTDRNGQVVLTREISDGENHDTYYVYNDFGQLVWVLPPMAADELSGTSWDNDNETLENFAYFYKYDKFGNCIKKRLPNSAPIVMIYDKAQRLILSQDGNMRAEKENKYLVIKYDDYGRTLYTGILQTEQSYEYLRDYLANEIVTEERTAENSSNNNLVVVPNKDKFEIENEIKKLNYKAPIRSVSEDIGYTCNYFSNQIEPLIVSYYDDYGFLNLLETDIKSELQFNANDFTSVIEQTSYTQTKDTSKGLQTGTRTYLLDNSGKYLTSAVYYDWLGQVIQARSTNHLDGYDIVRTNYDIAGNPTLTQKTHSKSPLTPSGGTGSGNLQGGSTQSPPEGDLGGLVVEEHKYEYDKALRLKKIIYKLNNNPQIILAENFYDEQGRLTSKKRHNNADTETFNYNIQNWLTKKTSGTFEENLAYHKAGNISSMMWKNGTTQNKYIYQYDGLNRLTSGVLENGGYGENFTYDKNGNILTLKRYSKNVLIDDLEMYDWKGNQLLGITENVENHSLTNINSLKEYRPKGDGTFKYDDNGNLIEDSDRKIWKIEYNVLNLPQQIYFKGGNQIINIYAADGRKLEAIYLTKITDNIESIERIFDNESEIREINGKHYIGNIEYEYEKLDDRFSPELTKIFNAEGYFENENWYYFRKDHLGNNREVAVVNGTTLQTVQINNYYASGLLWGGEKVLQKEPYSQPYLYNGKEYIEDFGYDIYDFGFRNYYATIGRFTSIDPLAEGTYSKSPYAYASNNFVGEIDFMGLFAAGGMGTTYYDPNFLNSSEGSGSYTDVARMLEDLFHQEKQGELGGIFGCGGGGINLAEAFCAYLNGNISGDVYASIERRYFEGGISLPDPYRVLNYKYKSSAEKVNQRLYGGEGKVKQDSKRKWYIERRGDGYDGVWISLEYKRPALHRPQVLTEFGEDKLTADVNYFIKNFFWQKFGMFPQGEMAESEACFKPAMYALGGTAAAIAAPYLWYYAPEVITFIEGSTKVSFGLGLVDGYIKSNKKVDGNIPPDLPYLIPNIPFQVGSQSMQGIMWFYNNK